jgi:hypothetical protein
MIVLEPDCKKCGAHQHPVKLVCDQCGKEHALREFRGCVIHFEGHPDDCSQDCESCTLEDDDSIMDESAEFHFCNLRCLSEYIADPIKDCFACYEDKVISILLYPDDFPTLLYTLGRASYDD